MWSGGTMANGGEMNPFKWNYDAKTLGYMAGGALVGAASGGAAGAVATSGMVKKPYSAGTGIQCTAAARLLSRGISHPKS